MSETTTPVVNAAAKKAAVAASAVAEAIPTVVATEQLTATLEVPTKIVLSQRGIVLVTAVAAAGAGAGILFGIQKLKERKRKHDIEQSVKESFETPVEAK